MPTLQELKRLRRHLAYQIHRGTLPLRRRGFSTFNEEQLINSYIAELLPDDYNRSLVDIGAGDGRTGSNSLALLKSGWNGLAIEGDNRKATKLRELYRNLPNATACERIVTPDTVLDLFAEFKIEKNLSLLSLDIDSYDYFVLDKILELYRPAIVVSEINEKIPPPIKFKVTYDPDFRLREHFFGYSIACLEELCARHHYAIVNLEYNNVFLVPKELAGSRELDPTTAYRQGYRDRPDRLEKFHRNANMEVLHSLTPEDGIKFIRKFFAKISDNYELSL